MQKEAFGGRGILACLFLLTLVIWPEPATSAPWPRAPSRLFVETRSDYFLSKNDGTNFQRYDGSIYGEFGLTRKVTIGGKAIYGTSSVTNVTANNNRSSTAAIGLSEIEGFAQYTLKQRTKDVFTVRMAGGRPAGLAAGVRPEIAADGTDIEARALYGRTIRDFPHKVFITAEAGYRLRLGEAADQLRIDLGIGYEPSPRWLFISEVQSTISAKNNAPDGADFDVVKLQPSAVWRFHHRYALRVGGVIELAARGFTPGVGGFLAVWTTF